jgi:hypothetical protein
MSEYLSCAETAKLVRAALKKAFPGIKFSVRSDVYSGGASIRVKWVDGPSEKAAKAVAGVYAGGGFDGMIDMAFSVDSWLMPDGSAAFASSPGTSGSMGVYAPYDHDAPAPGAKKVRFGADFVFCDKEWSVETFSAAVAKVCDDYGIEIPKITVSDYGGSPFIGGYHPVPNAGQDLSTLVHRELQKENHA